MHTVTLFICMNPQYKHIFNRANIDLSTINSALDIGCGEGKFANFLDENGIKVTAIDIEDAPYLRPNVIFKRNRFEDFETDQVFDLVHARHVVPFMENKPEQVRRMLTMGKYVLFTFFGPNDPWQNLSISKEEILEALHDVTILYISEEEFIGPKMDGGMKPWHIFTVVFKTNL